MKNYVRWLPWLVAGLATLWVVSGILPRSSSGFELGEFGRLPVVLNGRVQPLDSVARNSLRQLRNKQTALRDSRTRVSAIEWLLEAFNRPARADELKSFRIDNPELLGLLKLPENEKHFSFSEVRPSLTELERQARRVDEVPAQNRTAFEKQTMKLYSSLVLYQRLKNSLSPEFSTNFLAELTDYEQLLPAASAAAQAHQDGGQFDSAALNRIMVFVRRYSQMAELSHPLMVPPADPRAPDTDWQSMGASLVAAVEKGSLHPAVKWYAQMGRAYNQGDVNGFNQALGEYRGWLAAHFPQAYSKGQWESLFNRKEPFYKATALYTIAFLLVCFSWIRESAALRRSAYALVVVSLSIHTLGLIYRMALEGRPPVTNLYSSAIFIGWGAAVFGLVLERFSKSNLGGLGLATAAFIGLVTGIIAHNLALGGDTMEMMRAVLDTNFWLATHVVTITIGYVATFVAGFLGIVFIVFGVLNRAFDRATAVGMERLMYGAICFATLFSFIGTVLGGIWADQSWGRFWGWDPKENGALIIVLWNAMILHARWGNMIQERGMAVMSVFGNVVTSYSWFGVNMLGVGLHSYGFMDSGFKWLLLFVVSQAIIMGLAFLPAAYCRSQLFRSANSGPQGKAAKDAAAQRA
ncbi:MAG: cytochrome c biogenesis protein CcsA [Verrucomicrobia bacterium]|nr:cytochrome c biogenesis protein CcsA [Verrucomicrobiota bacterium]